MLWLTVYSLATMLVLASTRNLLGVQDSVDISQRTIPVDLKQRTVTIKVTGRSLAEIVAILAPFVGHGILVDDVPNLKGANLDLHGTAAEALDRVADTFDYSWTVSKNGTILMVKRFHNSDEHPQCNPREISQVALEMTKILSAVPYEAKSGASALKAMGKSLSPEQVRLLLSGRFLRMMELPPSQQTLLMSCIFNDIFADSHDEWTYLHRTLEHFEQAYVRAGIQDVEQFPTGGKAPYWLFDYWSPGSGANPIQEILMSSPVSSGGAP